MTIQTTEINLIKRIAQDAIVQRLGYCNSSALIDIEYNTDAIRIWVSSYPNATVVSRALHREGFVTAIEHASYGAVVEVTV